MMKKFHATISCFLFPAFVLFGGLGYSSTLNAQSSQGWGIKKSVEAMKLLISTLPIGPDKTKAQKALKRIEEGLKKETNGKPDPRIIDGSGWFVSSGAGTAKAYTNPDDEKTGESHFGWGKDEYVRVNVDLFQYVRSKLDKKCPNSDAVNKDEWMNLYEGIVLLHEGVHVDQAGGSSSADRKAKECEAWKLSYFLMVEITWQDSCLQNLWNKRVGTALTAMLENCGSL